MNAELTLDNLLSQDWLLGEEIAIYRTTSGAIIVFTDTEMYFIGQGGAISANKLGSAERIILD